EVGLTFVSPIQIEFKTNNLPTHMENENEKDNKVHELNDQYARESLGYAEVAGDCIESHLDLTDPKLSERIDFTSIERVHPDFVTRIPKSMDNLAYGADIDYQESQIYFLIRLHSEPELMSSYWLYSHSTKIADQLRPEENRDRNLIIPICMHSGPEAYPFSTSLFDCVEHPDLAREYKMFECFGGFSLYDCVEYSDIARQYKIFEEVTLWDLSKFSIDQLLQHGRAGLFQTLCKQGKAGDFRPALQKLRAEHIQPLPLGHVYSSAKYIYHRSAPEYAQENLEIFSSFVEDAATKEKIRLLPNEKAQ
ncbi:MAG: Rpn family recombination-promoting nuclease/putative transposase, partial [Bacteroidota bacterium]